MATNTSYSRNAPERPPIIVIGDVHDEYELFFQLLAQMPRHAHVIQIGDLPLYPSLMLRRRWQPPRGFFFIDGNHHSYDLTRGTIEPTEIVPNATYLPRGTVLNLEGRRVGVLGGADSVIDAAFRVRDEDWWPEEERISDEDVLRMVSRARGVGGLDLMLTHTPPASVTMAMMRDDKPPHPSAIQVERAWDLLGRPELISGHMHEEAHASAGQRFGGGVEVLPFLGVTVRT